MNVWFAWQKTPWSAYTPLNLATITSNSALEKLHIFEAANLWVESHWGRCCWLFILQKWLCGHDAAFPLHSYWIYRRVQATKLIRSRFFWYSTSNHPPIIFFHHSLICRLERTSSFLVHCTANIIVEYFPNSTRMRWHCHPLGCKRIQRPTAFSRAIPSTRLLFKWKICFFFHSKWHSDGHVVWFPHASSWISIKVPRSAHTDELVLMRCS